MGWASIVAAIMAVLGPLLRKWLEDRLRAKAAEFTAKGLRTGGAELDTAALFWAVHDDLWFFEWRRKRYVRTAIDADVPAAVAGVRALDAKAMAAVACD
jgi:hypothetical protein